MTVPAVLKSLVLEEYLFFELLKHSLRCSVQLPKASLVSFYIAIGGTETTVPLIDHKYATRCHFF